MKTTTGLKYIVFYDRLVGNTYFNWNFGQKLSKLKRCLLFVWSLIFMSLVSIHCFFGLKDAFFPSGNGFEFQKMVLDLNRSMSNLPLYLFFVGYIGHTIQSVIIAIFLQLKGPRILDLLNGRQDIKFDMKYEKKIGLILVLTKFLLTLLSNLLIAFFMLNYYDPGDV